MDTKKTDIDATHEKLEWVTPSLQMLNISNTNGAPGNPEGDGAAPFTAKPKISG